MLRKPLMTLLLAGTCSSAAPLFAQTGTDLIQLEEARQRVMQQRAESIVKEAVLESRRVAPTSAIRAESRLISAKVQISDDVALSEPVRKELLAKLNTEIAYLRGRAARPANVSAPAALSPPGTAPASPLSTTRQQNLVVDEARMKAQATEKAEITRTLDTIAALVKAGSHDQAQKEAEALLKRYPTHPVAILLNEQTNMADRIVDARTLIARTSEGFRAFQKGVDEANVVAKQDLEFDKDHFKDITKRRKISSLTPKEQEIVTALNQPYELKGGDRPFKQVVKEISDKIGVPIIIEEATLKNAEIDSSSPVGSDFKRVSLRTALKGMLAEKGLAYVIKDGVLQVTTIEKAQNSLITRAYYLGDLVQLQGTFGNAIIYGPQLNQIQVYENARVIMQMIEQSIEPSSWKANGGPGSVTFHLASMTLVVRQTAEVHFQMGSAFAGPR